MWRVWVDMSMVEVPSTTHETNLRRGSFNNTLILLFRSEEKGELKRDTFLLLRRICLRLSPLPSHNGI